jgi:hypothetical protein
VQCFLPRRRFLAGLVALLAGAAAVCNPGPGRTADRAAPDAAAVARTRTEVKMLDDLYKSAIVHITRTYVKARERTPAAAAAKQIFKDMAAKGWHEARLLDATGEPVNKANRPRTAFEKRAITQLKDGKPYYEEVDAHGGKPVLRAATPVPVVMQACVNCHPHTREGQLMGAIVYEVPIK